MKTNEASVQPGFNLEGNGHLSQICCDHQEDGTLRGERRGNVNWRGPLPRTFFLFFTCKHNDPALIRDLTSIAELRSHSLSLQTRPTSIQGWALFEAIWYIVQPIVAQCRANPCFNAYYWHGATIFLHQNRNSSQYMYMYNRKTGHLTILPYPTCTYKSDTITS